ncbi:hypothetical protein CRENBAI_021424 [Crenichthys baileyi]|uniref:PA14 domain-containing protein n=1 Tax=Crenichthys baileyi TaxID=28760 RepID=A0AAV9RWM7_9TELE
MPEDQYLVHVSVDGVPIPDNKICNGDYKPYSCSFYTRWWRTPTIYSLSPVTGLPGVYEINTLPDLLSCRSYMGGMPCVLLKPNSDELYDLQLDSETASWGYMSCMMTGTYVEVTRVSPSKGSIMGGTLLTIHGRFFDQTDDPARVLVGGLPCEVQSVADDRITCRTAERRVNEDTKAYPGGRGLKMEVWSGKWPNSLDEIWRYNENTTGYWSQWIDSLPYIFPKEYDLFTTRTKGFFVPTVSGNFSIYLHCDDRYYLELLQQEYYGLSHINIALFQEESSFTADQSDDAVNEIQDIVAAYEVFDEEQVCGMTVIAQQRSSRQVLTFNMWPSRVPVVREVQNISISSHCASHLCGSTFFKLSYGYAQTGPIPVSASASEMETALNNLWSIKPDTVQVTKQEDGQGSHYTITFNSDRGDFAALHFEVFSSNTNISVSEVTKGQSNMATFTLSWAGVPTAPIAFNATGSEVQSALENLMKADCPAEVLITQGTNVKYFNDFENSEFTGAQSGTPESHSGFCGSRSLKNADALFRETFTKESGGQYGPVSLNQHPVLCFGYKGLLRDEVGLKFTYSDSSGQTRAVTTRISTLFNKEDK